MRILVNCLASLALSAFAGTASAEPAPLPAHFPADRPTHLAQDVAPRAPSAQGLNSILEPAPPASPDYRFSMVPEARPATGELLLGALLAGIFIAYRRLTGR